VLLDSWLSWASQLVGIQRTGCVSFSGAFPELRKTFLSVLTWCVLTTMLVWTTLCAYTAVQHMDTLQMYNWVTHSVSTWDSGRRRIHCKFEVDFVVVCDHAKDIGCHLWASQTTECMKWTDVCSSGPRYTIVLRCSLYSIEHLVVLFLCFFKTFMLFAWYWYIHGEP